MSRSKGNLFRIVVTCNEPTWLDGCKTWVESLVCVAGPFTTQKRAEKLLTARGFTSSLYEYGLCLWSLHIGGDEASYSARILPCSRLKKTEDILCHRLPDHIVQDENFVE